MSAPLKNDSSRRVVLGAVLRRRTPKSLSGRIGLALLVLVLAVTVLGPLCTPYAPDRTVGIPFAQPSAGHPLGLDFLGRDVLSRVLSGGLSVVLYAGVATLAAYAAGLTLGLLAGYSRSWLEPVLMRLTDVLLSFPALVFLLLLATAFGRGITGVVIATALIQLPPIVRIVRSAALEQSVRGYVEAAVARGEGTFSVLGREILPNIARPVAADAGLRFSWSVLLIAGVNFLGLGLQPPAADWGLMVSENRGGIALNPSSMLVAAALLGALTLAINLLGDALAGGTE
ncbi:ABC transporter permease [Streptomyces sp. NBC_00878]|uniref:ABC transporter permease n=1 Tax=Streptomyces sp. NBC_00878 TaxID=2975854 RepID=UPI002258CE37|nr:ABC transporter permease [Streptomyces sp. NBC_00878]MCX4911677.1 ABC transporter permease [Streptomyces sp. NBC_00878]